VRVEESVEISRPVEEVFSYVANPDNLPEWSGIVLAIRKETQGAPKKGDRLTSVAKFLERRFETTSKGVSYEPPRRSSHRSTGGPFEQEWTRTFEETAGALHV
jgi:uncharacterized protein YndB with AHSA1/START domain